MNINVKSIDMKTIKSIIGMGIAIFSLLAGAASCSVKTTELSTDNLPVKSIVCGHARLFPADDNGTVEWDETADVSGLEVNILYGIEDDKGNVSYALKQIKTHEDGFFETEIGCPVGKTLKVKVNCQVLGNSYAQVEGSYGDYTSSEAWFYAEVEHDVPCGKSVYFALDMTASAHTGQGGLVQP